MVAVAVALAGCSDDPAERTASRPATTAPSVADSPTTSSTSSTVASEPATTSSTATTTTSSTENAGGPSAVADDQALGVRLTLSSTASSVAPDGSAHFDLVIENRSTTYVTYDSNVDFITLHAGSQHSWSPTCGYGRPAVVLYASIPPGGSHHSRPVYPSASDDVADGCRVAVGDYELRGTFRACRSERAFQDQQRESACDGPTTVAVVSLPFRQG